MSRLGYLVDTEENDKRMIKKNSIGNFMLVQIPFYTQFWNEQEVLQSRGLRWSIVSTSSPPWPQL